MNAAQHIQTMRSLLDRYPKLMLDIAWRVIRRFPLLKTGPTNTLCFVPE